MDGIGLLERGCLDVGEMTREESGEAFGEQVGSNPCLMAEIIARQRWFVQLYVDGAWRRVLGVDWDLKGTGD